MGSLVLRNRQITIFADGPEALTRAGATVLDAHHTQKVVAFVNPAERFQPGTARLLEAKLGPLVDLRRNDEPVRRVELAVATRWGLGMAGLDALARKRAVWRDDPRNDAIAAAAHAITAGRREDLHALGMSEDDASAVAGPSPRPRRVAVLVESPDHGRELLGRLHGWHLLADRWRPRVPGQVANRSVITLVHAGTSPEIDVDVLIRATPGDGPRWPRGFPPTSAAEVGAAIIDVLAPGDRR